MSMLDAKLRRTFGTALNDERTPEEIARGAIERHLGDVADESTDSLYDAAFSIAHSALVDAGLDARTASRVASEQAQLIAQP